jgi:hypothetical protein
MKYYIENPFKSTARAVFLLGRATAPEGATVMDDDEYPADEVVRNHVRSSYYQIGKCSFCGGPTPCLRED